MRSAPSRNGMSAAGSAAVLADRQRRHRCAALVAVGPLPGLLLRSVRRPAHARSASRHDDYVVVVSQLPAARAVR
jgi:hypothetical protein